MSKRANPPILGAFIVGGLFLIALAVIVLGTRGLLTTKSRLILNFPNSVNGLSVGSPVKFKGVTIGQVSNIRISVASAERTGTIPVVIEVDDDLIAGTTGEPLDLSNPTLVRTLVNKGLRGSLEMESFLTGLLYVGLNMYTNVPPATFVGPPSRYPEIPTIQTGLQRLAESLPKVERILDHLDSAAQEIQLAVKNANLGGLSQQVTTTLVDVQNVLRSPTITNTLVSIQKMADEFQATAAGLRSDLKPMIAELSATAAAANQTVAELDRVLEDAQRLVGNNSPVVGQLVATLADFQRAAVSLRQLTDYLARNPQSVLTGRDPAQGPTP